MNDKETINKEKKDGDVEQIENVEKCGCVESIDVLRKLCEQFVNVEKRKDKTVEKNLFWLKQAMCILMQDGNFKPSQTEIDVMTNCPVDGIEDRLYPILLGYMTTEKSSCGEICKVFEPEAVIDLILYICNLSFSVNKIFPEGLHRAPYMIEACERLFCQLELDKFIKWVPYFLETKKCIIRELPSQYKSILPEEFQQSCNEPEPVVSSNKPARRQTKPSTSPPNIKKSLKAEQTSIKFNQDQKKLDKTQIFYSSPAFWPPPPNYDDLDIANAKSCVRGGISTQTESGLDKSFACRPTTSPIIKSQQETKEARPVPDKYPQKGVTRTYKHF